MAKANTNCVLGDCLARDLLQDKCHAARVAAQICVLADVPLKRFLEENTYSL